MSLLIDKYLEYLAISRNLSQNTLDAYRQDLLNFTKFYPTNLTKTTQQIIEKYLRQLAKTGKKPRTQARHLSALRGLFLFLLDENEITADPTADIVQPKIPASLPKALSEKEIHKMLNFCKLSGDVKPKTVRLKVILYLLYGCGIRVSELTNLKISDITNGEGEVIKVTGKGGKTRLVPLGKTAFSLLVLYLENVHPKLNKHNGDWLFPSTKPNMPLTRQRIFQLIKELGRNVGVELAPHHLRHTFATHLIENEADLRSVQQMLGHASLNTTQIYTKVAGKRLREVLEQYHPLNKV